MPNHSNGTTATSRQCCWNSVAATASHRTWLVVTVANACAHGAGYRTTDLFVEVCIQPLRNLKVLRILDWATWAALIRSQQEVLEALKSLPSLQKIHVEDLKPETCFAKDLPLADMDEGQGANEP